jgi:hypothetical protein
MGDLFEASKRIKRCGLIPNEYISGRHGDVQHQVRRDVGPAHLIFCQI